MQTKVLFLSLTLLTSISYGAQTALLRVGGALRAVSAVEGVQAGVRVQRREALDVKASFSRRRVSGSSVVRRDEYNVFDEARKSLNLPQLGIPKQIGLWLSSAENKNLAVGSVYAALLLAALKGGLPIDYPNYAIVALGAQSVNCFTSAYALRSQNPVVRAGAASLDIVTMPVALTGLGVGGIEACRDLSTFLECAGTVFGAAPIAMADLFRSGESQGALRKRPGPR